MCGHRVRAKASLLSAMVIYPHSISSLPYDLVALRGNLSLSMPTFDRQGQTYLLLVPLFAGSDCCVSFLSWWFTSAVKRNRAESGSWDNLLNPMLRPVLRESLQRISFRSPCSQQSILIAEQSMSLHHESPSGPFRNSKLALSNLINLADWKLETRLYLWSPGCVNMEHWRACGLFGD